MLAHDAWATRRMLDMCRALSNDQFHQKFDIGLGSLHDNLTHIIGAMRRWTDRLAGRPPRPMLAAPKEFAHLAGERVDRAPDQLIALLNEAAADLAAVAEQCRQTGLDKTLVLDWPGKDGRKKRYTFTRAAALVHICTHSMHHRAQCTNMLKQLKVPGLSERLPDLSAVDWQAETELPPVEL
jgi:uncharacterized damage-inducible protein DinB